MSRRELITKHLDLWTGAVSQKSTRGRGSNSKVELTGVKKLRGLILELAVRGKLIEQDSGDDPASCLIAEVRNQRYALVGERQLGPQTKLSEVINTETPYQLPKGWEWCRLGDLAEIIRGVTYKKHQVLEQAAENHIALLRANNIQETITDEAAIYVPLELVNDRQLITKGDILIAMSSGSANLVGKAAQTNCDLQATFGAFCGAVRPLKQKLSSYLGLYTTTPLYRDQAQAAGKGIGINNLNKKALDNMLVPVPPEKEQHRIVQKVDELMALCDRLARQSGDQLEAHETLVDTLLGTLNRSEKTTELADNWARLAAHFDTLFTTEQSIEKLKQTILQLAVMGLLVEQKAGDGSASALLENLKLQKEQLVQKRQVKISNSLQILTDDTHILNLPTSWCSTTVGTIFQLQNGYAFKSGWFKSSGIKLVRNVNVSHGFIDWKEAVSLPEDLAQEFERFMLAEGDVVISLDRPLINTGLKYAVIREKDTPCLLLQRVARFQAFGNTVDPRYLERWLNSNMFTDAINPGRSNGVPHISTKQIEAIPFPLPPAKEQTRIVQKVDELMALCDRLKERLNQTSKTRCQLAEAVVTGALN